MKDVAMQTAKMGARADVPRKIKRKQQKPQKADKDRDKHMDNDKLKDNINTVCPEPEKLAPNPGGILLPLNDKTLYDVPLDKIALWKDTYPEVDVDRELKRMAAWLDSNPARRKTRRGITKFINNWLSVEQDRGGRFKGGSRTGKAVPVTMPCGWMRSRCIKGGCTCAGCLQSFQDGKIFPMTS